MDPIVQKKNPLAKATFTVLLIAGSTVVLYYGRAFLIPIAWSALLAMLVSPLDTRMTKAGMPRIAAALVSAFLVALAISAILTLLIWQIGELAKDAEQFRATLEGLLLSARELLTTRFNVDESEQQQMLDQFFRGLLGASTRPLQTILLTFGNLILVIVYMILLLLEKVRIKRFIHSIVDDRWKARDSMSDIGRMVQEFLLGRMIVMALLAILYTAGFLIAGVQYPFLLAIIAAILSIVPILGNMVAAVIAVAVTLLAGDTSGVWGILITMGIAQVVETYVLQPWLIGKRIDLNPFTVVASVIGFSLLWGPSGAILAMPLVAMVKIVFDHVGTLRPGGYLLGTEEDWIEHPKE